MLKKFILCAALLGTLPLFADAAIERANTVRSPGKVLPVIRAGIQIDGRTQDWEKVPFQDTLEYKIPRFSPPVNDADTSVRFKAAADEKNLYFLVLVRDNKIVSKPPFSYESDSVEIYLSPSSGKGKKGPGDIQIILAPEKEKFHFSGSDNFWKNMEVKAKPVKVDGGWGVEAAVPLKNDLWEITPYDGLKMGFSMHYNDNDSGTRDHKIAWYPDPKESSWSHNEPLGTLVFVWDPKAPKTPVRILAKTKKTKKTFAVVNTRPGCINLLMNGDFANGDAGYSRWMAGCRYQVREENGKHFLEVDGTDFPYGTLYNTLCTHPIHVFPGEKYLLRCKARIRNGKNGTANLTLAMKDENYNLFGAGEVRLSPNWKQKEFEFKIPARYVAHNSEIHALLSSREIGGGKIDFTDMELIRFVPNHVDAAFRFPQRPYCFLFDSGEKTAAELELKNFGTTEQTVKASFEIRDLFSGAKVKNFSASYTLQPGKNLKVQIPCTPGRNGGFSLTGIFTDSEGKSFRRAIEYAVAQPVRNPVQLGAICIAGDIYLRQEGKPMAALCRRLGFKSMRMFVSSIAPNGAGKYDYESMDILVDALNKEHIETIACVPVNKPGSRFPEFEAESLVQNIRAFVKHFRGRIKYYEIGNECNLPDGWRPEPNAREYSMLLRAAFAVIRSEDPQAQVLNCGFTGDPTSAYIREFLTLNKGNFYDALAVHSYAVRGRRMDTQICAEGISHIAKFHPQGRVIDTESGTDHKGFSEQVTLLSRKLPALQYAGIERHHEWGLNRMNGGYLFSPYSSPSPAIATYAFLNHFYPAQSKSVGLWELGENFNGVISELNGTLRGAFWRELPGNRDLLKIPADRDAKVFDVFGNDVTRTCPREGNLLVLNLPKEHAVYVQGILPPQEQIRKKTLSAAGALHVPCNTSVLLFPEYSQGFFRKELVPGQTETLRLLVHNFGKKSTVVRLNAVAPAGIQCTISPKELTLQPGEVKRVACAVTGTNGKGILEITGTADEKKLASLPVDISICGELLCRVSGRHVGIRNLMTEKVRGTIYFSSNVLDVVPYKKKNITLEPKQEKFFPFEIMPLQKKYPPNGLAASTATFVDDISGKSWKQTLSFPLLWVMRGAPLPQDAGKWMDKWDRKNKMVLAMAGTDFKAEIKCRIKAGKLYCAIRVRDDHHFQKQERGEIGGGDSVIIGIDPAFSTQTASGYDKGTFEAGFALRSDGGIEKYVWDGAFGLERAVPFTAAEARIFRHGGFTNYELVIPVRLPAGAKRFGLGIRINDRTADGKLRSLQFGSGLNEVRSARDFGTAAIE